MRATAKAQLPLVDRPLFTIAKAPYWLKMLSVYFKAIPPAFNVNFGARQVSIAQYLMLFEEMFNTTEKLTQSNRQIIFFLRFCSEQDTAIELSVL